MIREHFKPGLDVILAPGKPVQQKPLRVTIKDSLLNQGNHGRGRHKLAIPESSKPTRKVCFVRSNRRGESVVLMVVVKGTTSATSVCEGEWWGALAALKALNHSAICRIGYRVWIRVGAKTHRCAGAGDM